MFVVSLNLTTQKGDIMIAKNESDIIGGKLMRIYAMCCTDKFPVDKLHQILDLIENGKINLLYSIEKNAIKAWKPEIQEFFVKNHRAKICIMGACNVPVKQIKGIARSLGIPANALDLHLDYKNLEKEIDVNVIIRSNNYSGVIIGSVPHKLVGINGYDSIFSALAEKAPDLLVIRSIDNSGKLSLSKNALNIGFREICLHILNGVHEK